ncbi:hypothetical protein AWRI1631_41790 [Saccharomyces cerevisiae AWRI1631]|uniref:Uncharacterized protein n=1 Tax=Saccharomyces cerevisiae (strain AWRI1631) TaxID=545124 RepID=B5VFK9_YEAS6|nr:hypothetical protein AWRI1631_41790 [Saccharomyces cerevisiae AWRI1631]
MVSIEDFNSVSLLSIVLSSFFIISLDFSSSAFSFEDSSSSFFSPSSTLALDSCAARSCSFKLSRSRLLSRSIDRSFSSFLVILSLYERISSCKLFIVFCFSSKSSSLLKLTFSSSLLVLSISLAFNSFSFCSLINSSSKVLIFSEYSCVIVEDPSLSSFLSFSKA